MFWLLPCWKVNRVFTGVLPRRRRLKKLLSLSDQEGGSPPRGHLSLSSSWVELYAVCFLSCVPVWPCCLTTVVNPRSFFFETSLCFLSNSLGWFESKLVADCWCYCFEVLFLTSRYGGLGPVCGVTGASTPPRSCLLWEESSHRQDVCCTQSNAASDNKVGPTHSSR